MKVKDFYNNCVAKLSKDFTSSESKKLVEILFEDLLQVKRTSLFFSEGELTFIQISKIQEAISRLLKHEPVQYITGIAHFMDFTLQVNPGVLIPRPETEELVEWMVNEVKEEKLKAIDIGTGSGCIAIALKRLKSGWNVTAIDISKEAIKTASLNAQSLNQDIRFIQSDIKDVSFNEDKFDLIVSNPPYITLAEKDKLDKNVVDHEPHIALFEPEEFHSYKAIISFAGKYLTPYGQIFVEINQDKALKMRDLFMGEFEIVELRKDISSNYRFLKAEKIKNKFRQ